jgi:hypothetical protein
VRAAPRGSQIEVVLPQLSQHLPARLDYDRRMTGGSYHGNAVKDGRVARGWLCGHFIDPGSVRSSTDVEVKWAIHPLGDTRVGWTVGEQRTTMVILVDGRFRIDLTEGSVTLASQGDYLMWGPGIDHSWQALARSVVVVIRWPSAPG